MIESVGMIVWPFGGGACGAVSNIVNSPVATLLIWGDDHVLLYSDGFCAIAGARHPAALGGWSRGDVVSRRDQPIVFQRPGGDETLTLDLFYTPIHAADGSVSVVMCTIVDNSRSVDVLAFGRRQALLLQRQFVRRRSAATAAPAAGSPSPCPANAGHRRGEM